MHRAVASAVLILTAAPALAGSTDQPVASPPLLSPAETSQDWTGAYGGLQFDLIADGSFDAVGRTAGVEGNVFGAFGGYRHDFGSFVLGGEVDYMFGDATIDAPAGAGGAFDVDIDRLWRLGVEAGFDAGRAFVYGTAGYANIQFTDRANDTVSSDGYFFGLGADVLATDSITIGLEILKHEFDDFSGSAQGATLDLLTTGINVSYRF